MIGKNSVKSYGYSKNTCTQHSKEAKHLLSKLGKFNLFALENTISGELLKCFTVSELQQTCLESLHDYSFSLSVELLCLNEKFYESVYFFLSLSSFYQMALALLT